MLDDFQTVEVETGETTIFARWSGSGPPVLLLHGFPQTHLMWRAVAPVLARDFTVVCADLRGYGRSGHPASTPDHAPYTKRAMAQDMVETCEEIIQAAGGEILRTPGTVTRDKLGIDSNHWVGTVRMGTNPAASVVNPDCQSHEIPNLFIGDASVFPSYPEKNPTLTNIALSWRTSELLIEKFRRREFSFPR